MEKYDHEEKYSQFELVSDTEMGEIGEKLERNIKESIKEAIKKEIDGMRLAAWFELHKATNSQMFKWMMELSKEAQIEFREENGEIFLLCNFCPEDYSETFLVKTTLKAAIEFSIYNDESHEQSVRKRIANALRAAADDIEQ